MDSYNYSKKQDTIFSCTCSDAIGAGAPFVWGICGVCVLATLGMCAVGSAAGRAGVLFSGMLWERPQTEINLSQENRPKYTSDLFQILGLKTLCSKSKTDYVTDSSIKMNSFEIVVLWFLELPTRLQLTVSIVTFDP